LIATTHLLLQQSFKFIGKLCAPVTVVKGAKVLKL
jgi:hypothetical protein